MEEKDRLFLTSEVGKFVSPLTDPRHFTPTLTEQEDGWKSE